MHNHYIANTFKGQTDLSAFYIVNPITFWEQYFFSAFPFIRYWAVLRTTMSVTSCVLDNMKENGKSIHSNFCKVESWKNINITAFYWKIYSFYSQRTHSYQLRGGDF